MLLGLQTQTLLGEERRELLEEGPLAGLFRVHAVDVVDLEQSVVLLVVFGFAHLARDLVAAAQAEAADLRERHVHVMVALRVAAGAQEAEAVRQHVEHARARYGRSFVALLALGALRALLATVATAIAAAVAATLISATAPTRPLTGLLGRAGGSSWGRPGRSRLGLNRLRRGRLRRGRLG